MSKIDVLTFRTIHGLLAECGGDTALVRKRLAAMALNDNRLLRALVTQYLPGIVDRAVAQTMTLVAGKVSGPQTGTTPATAAPKRKRSTTISDRAMDALLGSLGERVGVSKSPEGMTALIHPPIGHPAGARHADTIRSLAKVFAAQRLDAMAAKADRKPRSR